MNQVNNFSSTPDLTQLAVSINAALQSYSDKDWNYSRIHLELRRLENVSGPYALWIDHLESGTKDFRAYSQEVDWGMRHSSELGILEIISLRLNRALLDTITDARRPVIRVVKKEELAKQGITAAFWYQVEEVGGEDFDSR